MRNARSIFALCMLSMLTLDGCAAINAYTQSPAAVPLEQAAVAAAVASVVKGDAVKAARIVSIAKAVLAADTGVSVALPDVEKLINNKVLALNLPAADQILAGILTAAVTEAIQAQISIATQGAISSSTQLAIATVCKWVITDAGG